MNLLERLGLKRRQARPVGQNLEKHRDGPGPSLRKQWLLKGSILLGLVVVTLLALPRENIYEFSTRVGDEWRQASLRAPFSFAVYKDADSLRTERRLIRSSVPPIFREVQNAQEEMAEHRDTVASQLERAFEAYGSYLFHRSRGQMELAEDDSLRYLQLRSRARPKLNAAEWQALARSYAAQVPGLPVSSRERQGGRLDRELLSDAWRLGASLVHTGVLNVPRDSVRTDEIVVRNLEEHNEWRKSTDAVYGINEVYQHAQEEFAQTHADDPQSARIATSFFRAIFQPSLEFMRGESRRQWSQRAERISPTRGKIDAGTVIVSRGERVTPEIKRQLASLETAQRELSGETFLWKRVTGQFMLVVITYLIFFLYLYLLRRSIFENNRHVLLISILFVLIVALYAIAVRVDPNWMYGVPIAITSVLLTVMFDSRVGFFGTLTLAIVGALMLNFNFVFFFAALFGGALGLFSVRDIKNRGQFFLSGAVVLVGYAAVLGAAWLYDSASTTQITSDLAAAAVNGFLLIMAYPLLWVFERLFDITTDLTLLELSDTNRDLLKDLALRAPGTFHHSLQVANLAEAAADAIGANALLARVGALYHDIGKMLKPEYFVENQNRGVNPHDELKPRMSALIIASHVKEGLEMGRQHNLPRRVLDFIPMHHGTTRIEFFYRKALAQQGENDPELLESEFRYPGPRPNSVETGILMLADSVEAACRSLHEPTHKRLDNVIESIFEARTEDGQLDGCDLTFRQLSLIKETFLNVLVGVHHGRVKYPDQDEKAEGRDTGDIVVDEEAEVVASDDASHNGHGPEQREVEDDLGRRVE